jgi:23S rRNA (uridine2552-2'-O)-methyltransferase
MAEKHMKQNRTKRNDWEDHYSRKARQEKYPARSVYKLKEIQQKFHLMRKGGRVLDLGCAPGSWLMYTAEEVGDKGMVVGVDVRALTVQLPQNVRVLKEDVFIVDVAVLTPGGKKFHVVLSDMAPDTTGNKHVDSARSYNLCETALLIARKTLVPGGSFVCKIFQGEDFDRFLALVKETFQSCKIYKPRSTRKASKEIYIIGLNKQIEAEVPELTEQEETA